MYLYLNTYTEISNGEFHGNYKNNIQKMFSNDELKLINAWNYDGNLNLIIHRVTE